MSQTLTRASEGDNARHQEGLINETLAWCCDVFRTRRARLVRPLDGGRWIVYTRQYDNLITHPADYAEIAMAYTVGLSRQPLVVTRPRVSHADGSNLRPIARGGYLGIPVICQDRLIGVVELSGDIQPDMEMAMFSAMPRLQSAAERLVFDPRLSRRGQITRDAIVVLSSAIWTDGEIVLTEEDMRFLATIDGPTTVADSARIAGIEDDRAVELAESFVERGLIALHVA